jgi:CDGSH iron-sulfur domain-containing protein 3
VTGPTEKSNLMITDQPMEDKKEFKSQAIIEIIDNGPIKITGNILIRDSKRDITDKPEEVYLCRCGRSQNKPYCDESHKK